MEAAAYRAAKMNEQEGRQKQEQVRKAWFRDGSGGTLREPVQEDPKPRPIH